MHVDAPAIRDKAIQEWIEAFQPLDSVIAEYRGLVGHRPTRELASEVRPKLLTGLHELRPKIETVRRRAADEFKTFFGTEKDKDHARDLFFVTTAVGHALDTIDSKRRPILQAIGESEILDHGVGENSSVLTYLRLLTSDFNQNKIPVTTSMCEKLGTHTFLVHEAHPFFKTYETFDLRALESRMAGLDAREVKTDEPNNPALFKDVYPSKSLGDGSAFSL